MLNKWLCVLVSNSLMLFNMHAFLIKKKVCQQLSWFIPNTAVPTTMFKQAEQTEDHVLNGPPWTESMKVGKERTYKNCSPLEPLAPAVRPWDDDLGAALPTPLAFLWGIHSSASVYCKSQEVVTVLITRYPRGGSALRLLKEVSEEYLWNEW